MLQYLIALNDVHNFWLSAPEYRSLFREEFLNAKISLENFNLNNVFLGKYHSESTNFAAYIGLRKEIDMWKHKSYPATRDENISILDDYLALCEENRVRPIMFSTPFSEGYVKHFSKQKLDEFYYLVREAQKKHPSAVFFDGWRLSNFSYADFIDGTHLNLQGAAKFSSILNDIILQLDKIPLDAKVLIK